MTTSSSPHVQLITIIGSGDTINAAILDGQTQANQRLDTRDRATHAQIIQAQTLHVSPLTVGLLEAFSTPRFYHIISIVLTEPNLE